MNLTRLRARVEGIHGRPNGHVMLDLSAGHDIQLDSRYVDGGFLEAMRSSICGLDHRVPRTITVLYDPRTVSSLSHGVVEVLYGGKSVYRNPDYAQKNGR